MAFLVCQVSLPCQITGEACCRQNWKLADPVSEAKCHSAGDQQCIASEWSQGSCLTRTQRAQSWRLLPLPKCHSFHWRRVSLQSCHSLSGTCDVAAKPRSCFDRSLSWSYIRNKFQCRETCQKTADLIAHTCGCLCCCEVEQNWTRRNHSVNCCSGWDEFSCKTFELISGEGR